jgi:phage-related minor tail protein
MKISQPVVSNKNTPAKNAPNNVSSNVPANAPSMDAELAALKAQIAALAQENERLKAQKASRVSWKVSEKGALSVYGLGRFPVSLYKGQWEKLFTLIPQLQAFIKENAALLSEKPADHKTAAVVKAETPAA